jgi:hypothetical protein
MISIRTDVLARTVSEFAIGMVALAAITGVCFAVGLHSTPTAFLYLIVIVLLSGVGRCR